MSLIVLNMKLLLPLSILSSPSPGVLCGQNLLIFTLTTIIFFSFSASNPTMLL
ncbi:unnamed protein product [Meloidogyne enterolobii]|uniref:Uncharacterized protein n=1 Tax=Meloidogyne enterolobii TaxID=390850 RepID=A0ACB0YGD3_MELEN